MVSSLGNDVNTGIVVTRLGESRRRRLATFLVHPVIITIYRSAMLDGVRQCIFPRMLHLQMNVTGTFNASILSTIGILAYAPGARICEIQYSPLPLSMLVL